MSADLLIKNAKNRDASRHLRGMRLRGGGGGFSAITHKAESSAAREIDAAGPPSPAGHGGRARAHDGPGLHGPGRLDDGHRSGGPGRHHHRDRPPPERPRSSTRARFWRTRPPTSTRARWWISANSAASTSTTSKHLRPMWEGGALGFKGFMCELHGVPDLSEGVLLNIMREVKSFGGTVMLHCESDSILNKSKEKIDADNRTDYMCISDWRNPESEYVATLDAVALAELTGCTVLVAHVSQPVFAGGHPGGARARSADFRRKLSPVFLSRSLASRRTRTVRQVHAGHPLRRDARRKCAPRSGAAWWTPSAPTTAPSPASGRWTA